MARVNISGNFALDFLGLGGLQDDAIGEPIVTENSVTVHLTSGVFVAEGFGFSMFPTSGTVTAMSFSQDGRVVASAEDISIAVADIINVQGKPSLPEWVIRDVLAGDDTFNLGGGNDRVAGLGGDDFIDGGNGRDTVLYETSSAAYAVDKQADGTWTVTGSGDVDTLKNIEIVQFSDAQLRLDVDGHAGDAFRLYQAAFDRTPDTDGLSYWIQRLDQGTDLREAAHGFVYSPEFNDTYGELENAGFVTALYNNVLDRDPDAEGLSFWVDQLDQGARDRASVLVGFSESDENVALVGATIEDGIWL